MSVGVLRSGGSYTIYWSGGNRAWSWDNKTGLRLLDLGRPAVLADRGMILKRVTELGGRLDIRSPAYNNETHRIHVRGKNGDYELDYSLKLRPYQRAGRYLDFNRLKWQFSKQWLFRDMSDSVRETVHLKGVEPYAKSVEMLRSKLVPEFNLKKQKKKRIWLKHQSALNGSVDTLMSFVAANGREINRLNLTKIFPRVRIRVLGTYTTDRNVMILVGIGKKSRSHIDSIDVHGLAGLSVDKSTGNLLKRI